MHEGKSVSIIVPAYNEEATIRQVVADFIAHPAVDEVLVVDNNCKDKTAEIASDAGARVVEELLPGYGCALRCGMREAKSDLFVLVEADGSFRASDLSKFLAYIEGGTMVIGTRTTRQMVQQGANMAFLLRWGNVAVAKLLELFWYLAAEPRLTDVGCTYRALPREVYDTIKDGLSEAGPSFSPEMMCEVLRHRLRLIEIPVNYHARAGGESKHSDGLIKVSKTALGMLGTIFRKRLEPRPVRSVLPEEGEAA
jgi:glycosyltransferase involved in cell wall biosynthesis